VIHTEVSDRQVGFLKGHGTIVNAEGELSATVSGTVERINKLVSTRAVSQRYQGQVGDVVVARVVEVAQSRWKLDINSRQHGSLLLTSINLPGSMQQRRRTQLDELEMRKYFREHDVVSVSSGRCKSAMNSCARRLKYIQYMGTVLFSCIREAANTTKLVLLKHNECCDVDNLAAFEGTVGRCTSNVNFGKRAYGRRKSQRAAQRSKSHFISLGGDVEAVLGMNGFVWIGATTRAAAAGAEEAEAAGESKAGDDDADGDANEDADEAALVDAKATSATSSTVPQQELPGVPLAVRRRAVAAANVVRLLARAGVALGADALVAAVGAALSLGADDAPAQLLLLGALRDAVIAAALAARH
jgi:exosome complex RNA-binding protein Rrp4